MKSYTITVNGNVYDVTVEENVGGAAQAAPVARQAAVPVSVQVAAPAPVSVRAAVVHVPFQAAHPEDKNSYSVM